MSFTPPFFSKLNKAASDLLKFKFDNKFTVKQTSEGGVTVESGGALLNGGDGYVKGEFAVDVVNVELNAKTKGELSGELSSKKLIDGVKITANGSLSGKGPSGGLSFEYAQDFFATTFGVSGKAGSTVVEASGVVGFDGMSVGGNIEYDVKTKTDADFNVGFQYSQNDFTAALITQERGNILVGSVVQNVSKSNTVGAQFTYSPYAEDASQKSVLAISSSLKLDSSTSVKASVNTLQTLNTEIVQKLSDPRIKLGLTSSFSRQDSAIVCGKVGVTVALGEF
jgi:hypothetical protein